MKRTIGLATALLLTLAAAASAQLKLIESGSSQSSARIQAACEKSFRITPTTLLTIDCPTPDSEPAKVHLLDAWDPAASYFVLYPLRPQPAAAIEPYGRILHGSPDFLILKTDHRTLNRFAPFSAYELVRITPRHLSTPALARQSHSTEFQRDTRIEQLVGAVSADSIWATIATLQRLERYALEAGAVESTEWITAFLRGLGFDTLYTETFEPDWTPNIVAIKYGSLDRASEYVIGAHYDAYAKGAPGADDNASGTAGVLEAARLLGRCSFDKTIRVILFSGEEEGLFGSADYTLRAFERGDAIRGMINLDMIAHMRPEWALDVDVAVDDQSQELFGQYTALTRLYVPGLAVFDGSQSKYARGSDHASFWDQGYPALFLNDELKSDDGGFNSYIHTDADTLGFSANSKELARLITQSAVATLAASAGVNDQPAAVRPHRLDARQEAITTQRAARGLVRISLPAITGHSTWLYIYDLKGSCICSRPILPSSTELTVPVLSAGVYTAVLRSNSPGHSRSCRLLIP